MPINFVIKAVATVALEAAQIGLQASKRTRGPRLSETQVTDASYGTPLPRFLGARKFSGQIIWSRDLIPVDKTTKIKGGGKQTTTSAQWTAGVAFADCRGSVGPIDKVLKIWLDDTLAYDATGTGPISYASSLGFDLSQVMRIYNGSETQLPDPAYVDFCEEKYGPNSAPAFRGTALIVFDKMPCDNFGNRAPQVTVLAVSAAAPIHPYDERTISQVPGASFIFSPGGQWMTHWSGSVFDWWDVPTRTHMGFSPGANIFAQLTYPSLDKSGTAWFVGDRLEFSVVTYLFKITPLGTPELTLTNAASYILGITRALDMPDGSVRVLSSYDVTAGYLDGAAHVAIADSGRDWCIDDNSDVWMISQPTGASSSVTLTNLTGTGTLTFTAAGRSGPNAARICYVAKPGHFLIASDGHYYLVDRGTLAVTASGVAPWGGTPDLPAQDPTRTSFWAGFSEFSLTDATLIRTLNQNDWVFPSSYAETGFDHVNDAIWARISGTPAPTLRVLYVDRNANAGTTLGAIVDAMCDSADLTDRDTSLLTQYVAGYSWTRGDVKSQMEPLLDIHDVDARPHDFTIQFLPRGSAASGTILTADLARNGDSPRYTVPIVQDTDLPVLIRVNFADTGFDQQPNNVLSPLPTDSVDSQRDVVIDLSTCAASATEAQQLSDRYMRRQWTSKDTVQASLTEQQLALEPGDVTTLSLDGVAWNAKLEKATVAGTRYDCTFRRDQASVAVLNTATVGPEMQGGSTDTIIIPAPIRGFIVDAPFRSDDDADIRPLLYAGAGVYAALPYPGAVVYERTGVGTSAAYDQLFDTLPTGATWGTCNGALSNVPSPWLWDRGNVLNISLQSGSLTAVSEADIDADPSLNLFLIGRPGAWEYVNVTTPTLQGDGSWNLSGFKRGRRGTEWACAGHTTGEVVLLAIALKPEEMGSDDIGATLSFKAQAIGRILDVAPAIDVAPYMAETLMPYAPASLAWSTDGTDMTGTITRRTRTGGAWVGGSTIPLGENEEAYEVDVYHAGVLKRTIAVSGTNVFTYTGAQIAADGNSVGVAPPSHVYQMSDAVGRGFALAA